VLLSGNHAEIARWRRREAIRRTKASRPDLFEKIDLSTKADVKLLRELEQEQ
jgi:tRNA (guanine37-N1)-methyltransferase